MAGMNANDIDLWEINQAFAAVVMQTTRALDDLERRGLATALITMCIGGGQGIATTIERV
jgi:acetyl-CoA C-acetyltransferase